MRQPAVTGDEPQLGLLAWAGAFKLAWDLFEAALTAITEWETRGMKVQRAVEQRRIVAPRYTKGRQANYEG